MIVPHPDSLSIAVGTAFAVVVGVAPLGAGLVAFLWMLRRLWRRRPRRPGRGPFTRRQWYRTEYLPSAHWAEFRHGWWLAHPDAVCAGCGHGGHPMDLHHLTYVRIGHERDTDVVPLHRACHDAVHAGRLLVASR
jgi:hypothetical protein